MLFRSVEQTAKELFQQIAHEYGGIVTGGSFLVGVVPQEEIARIATQAMDRMASAMGQLMALPDVGEVSSIKAEARQLYQAALAQVQTVSPGYKDKLNLNTGTTDFNPPQEGIGGGDVNQNIDTWKQITGQL